MEIAQVAKPESRPLIDLVSPLAEVHLCPTSGSRSLRTRIALPAGEVLHCFEARALLERPNYLTVQMGESQHVMLEPQWLQYINHSCDPNVFFDTTHRQVRLLEAVVVGEELTFFYPSTEWDMEQPFDCWCRSERCLQTIRGSAHVAPEILSRYSLSPFVQGQLRCRDLL